ncbi:hypothetical protein Tco_1350629, partial [Tanacetum coccineum]
ALLEDDAEPRDAADVLEDAANVLEDAEVSKHLILPNKFISFLFRMSYQTLSLFLVAQSGNTN